MPNAYPQQSLGMPFYQSQAPQMNYPQPYQSFATPKQNPCSPVWVQGIAGAKAYPMGPNEKAVLFDSESAVFYIKVTDATGMPMPLRIFDYNERIEVSSGEDYVTRSEFNSISKKIDGLSKFMEELSAPSTAN